jgi:hypothetical protein
VKIAQLSATDQHASTPENTDHFAALPSKKSANRMQEQNSMARRAGHEAAMMIGNVRN